MKSRYLIPVSFFIVCQTVYDFYAPFQSTNWSIFYFASMYFSWLLLLIIIDKPCNKLKKIPYFVIGIGLVLYIATELGKVGKSYEDYYSSVNSIQACVLPIAVMITGLTYFIFKKHGNCERLD